MKNIVDMKTVEALELLGILVNDQIFGGAGTAPRVAQ